MQPQWFPRRFTRITDVTPTFQTVFAAGAGRVRFTHVVIQNASGVNQAITLRAVDDSPIILTVSLTNSISIVIPGWDVDAEGLEIGGGTGAAGVNATFFYGVGPLALS